jgi:hypothetical protein
VFFERITIYARALPGVCTAGYILSPIHATANGPIFAVRMVADRHIVKQVQPDEVFPIIKQRRERRKSGSKTASDPETYYQKQCKPMVKNPGLMKRRWVIF